MPISQATFLVDPFVPMALMGAIIGLIATYSDAPPKNPRLWSIACVGIYLFLAIGFFCAVELPCYFDLIPQPSFSATKSCNEFMWNGYVDWPLRALFGWRPNAPTYKAWWSTTWLILAFVIQLQAGLYALLHTVKWRVARIRARRAASVPPAD
ncbi:MAG: hypothetical protein RLZZ324_496 [Candidatus Parcubacteria bacterium]|jgi:hypothetical protein